MREVSKADFYSPIYDKHLNVYPSIIGNFPYTSLWQFLNRPGSPPYGKTVDRVEGGVVVTSYFIHEG